MKISKQHNWVFSVKLFNHGFYSSNFREQLLIGFFPNSVKVKSAHTTSVVAKDHTINIYHWHNF